MDKNESSYNITELNQIKSMVEMCNIPDISTLMKYLISTNTFISLKSLCY